MKLSSINDYFQVAAAVGVIIGLVLVGVEIRESNRISVQQATSANWTNWAQFSMSELETGIAATIVKAMKSPDELTLEDKINLDSWLSAYLSLMEHDYASLILTNAQTKRWRLICKACGTTHRATLVIPSAEAGWRQICTGCHLP
ncbi:MAG: hypothetical protein AAGI11_05420 [Pseudomonadota bacterium]